jgi:subtilase family serine protease
MRILTKTATVFIAFIICTVITGLFPVEVQANPGPDLIVQSIEFSPEEPALGEVVTISVTLKNQGTSKTGLSHVDCHIDDTVLTSGYVTIIEAGATRTVTLTWTAEGGNHIITAIADSKDEVTEDDETNNTKTYSFTTLAADLVIQSISWLPETASKGDDVVISVTVKNLGNNKSVNSRLHLYIDDTSRGYHDLTAINPGGTITKTFDWIAPAGQHTIKAIVDDTDLVNESDETNNEKTSTFSTLAPDLIIQGITWTPENPSKTDEVTFTITVENQGIGRADSCFLGYYIDGEYHSAISISSLEGETAVNATFEWTVLSEEHEFKAVADLYNDVVESDEKNNETTVSFYTLVPDLMVKDITWTPENPGIGDTITFTATIMNQGVGTAEATTMGYYLGGAFTGYLNIPALAPGAQTTKTFEWTGALDILSCNVKVVADLDQMLLENDEINNSLIRDITLLLPDLTITDISWLPENPIVGDTVTIKVEVKNEGGGKAGNHYIAYYIDDTLLSSDRINSIDSAASINMTHSWQVQNGIHSFKAVIDHSRRVTESDESNNEKKVTIIPDMPDLFISNVTWSPVNISTDEEVTLSISVTNQGSTPASSCRLVCHIDGINIGYQDLEVIGAGGSTTIEFPWIAAEGPHTVELVVDTNDIVYEFDETNNQRLVCIPPPDLFIQDITWAPTAAAAGDTITITATIINQGNGKAHESLVTYYIDDILVSSQTLPAINAGETIFSSYDWVVETGKHDIRIYVDTGKIITEVDETNNEKSALFAAQTPDLAIETVRWSMEDALVDNDVTFTVTLKNRGSCETGISQLDFYIDDIVVESQEIFVLRPGETTILTLCENVEPGIHTLNIIADPEDQMVEIDETNNEEELPFSTMAPDLQVKNITFSPLSASAGDTVTITVKMENHGRGVAMNTRLDLLVDGSVIDSMDIEEIAIGAIITQEFTWVVEEGLHEVQAFVDMDELVLENNEDNNVVSKTLTVSAPETTEHQVIDLSASDDSSSGGFLANSWFLIVIAAALLGGAAFYIAYKSFRQE